MRNILSENWALRVAHVPGTVPASITYGNWIDVTGYREISFVANCAALDDDCDLTVYENSTNSSSGATAVAGATDDFINGTDENRIGVIELDVSKLGDGKNYVALAVTPASALNFFSANALLGSANRSPVSNGTADGVAWTTTAT